MIAEEKGKIIDLETWKLLKEIDQCKQVIQEAEEMLDAAIAEPEEEPGKDDEI